MEFPKHKTIDIVGVGNALIDLIAEVDDVFLAERALEKGTMQLVEAEDAKRYLTDLSDLKVKTEAGGGCANTIKGAAYAGAQTVFFGSVGEDGYGQLYDAALTRHGVDAKLTRLPLLTGNAIGYVTPDAERTFTTCIGAACGLMPQHLDESVFEQAKIVHLEGFQFEGPTEKTQRQAIEYAKQHGALVSLDLSDPSLIDRHHDMFTDLLKHDVDIVFANEAEGEAFSRQSDFQVAHSLLAKDTQIAVLKRGAAGSLIAQDGEITHAPAVPTEVVDTTGAGDMYAAGFLADLAAGNTMDSAGLRGAMLASQVIAKFGTALV